MNIRMSRFRSLRTLALTLALIFVVAAVSMAVFWLSPADRFGSEGVLANAVAISILILPILLTIVAIRLISDHVAERKSVEEKLQKARDELEVRVKQRTDELSRTIDSLHTEATERKRVEDALRESEAKLRGLYEMSPLGFALTDMKGRYVEFNESFRRICGYSEEELKLLDYWKLTPKKYEAEEAKQLESLNRAGHYGPFEKEYVRRDGTLVPLRLSGVLVENRAGEHFIWSVVEDITERRQSEEVLRKTRDELEVRVQKRTAELVTINRELSREVAERGRAEGKLKELNETLEQRVAQRTAEAKRRAEELEQFAYVTSHDLKAPLRGIANLADWLQEDLSGKLSKDTAEQFMLLKDRVGRMQALIEGLLEYSRVGRTHGVSELVDTRKLLEETLDTLALPAEVVVNIAPGMPTLRTDRLRLGQVFANLVGNAVKHHDGSQPHVWVKVQEKNRFFEFSVADDGPGIAPQYHERVFMMFQTLMPRDVGNDSGIGLALVKKIVEDQGGTVTLESQEGEGSTFRFTWPKSGNAEAGFSTGE
jgi:PAS domain S-box-containing protein